MPAKKLYELLYSRTCSRQNRQYSLARSRPFGARWVAGASQRGHSQGGSSARSLRSWSGLTLMRSNSGEFGFIVFDYAAAAREPARLDRGQMGAAPWLPAAPSRSYFAHDLIRKSVSTFRDHALSHTSWLCTILLRQS